MDSERRNTTINFFISFLFVCLIIIAWELLVKIQNIPTILLPAPSQILASIIQNRGELWFHGQTTLLAVLEGFVLGSGLGIGLAVLLTLSERVEKALSPILVFLQSIPKVTVAPLIIVWFGLGFLSKMVMVILMVFFPSMVNTLEGLKIEPEYRNLASVYNASRWKVMKKIRIKNALPNIFTGLRICTTLSVIGVAVTEMVGSQRGLGHLLVLYQSYLNTPGMFAVIVIFGVFGFTFYELVGYAKKKLIPWYRAE